MALVVINVKEPREAQIWNCCTEIQFSGFYRTAIKSNLRQKSSEDFKTFARPNVVCGQNLVTLRLRNKTIHKDI